MATATMVFSEPKVPLLWDVSATLLDVELAYDFSVILTEPEYSTYQFSRFFWYRNRSRISEGYRLRATSIELHSPLLLSCHRTFDSRTSGVASDLSGSVELVIDSREAGVGSQQT
jgi:hypothetical protein